MADDLDLKELASQALDPASLVVVLAKKRSGDPHAPVPVVAEGR